MANTAQGYQALIEALNTAALSFQASIGQHNGPNGSYIKVSTVQGGVEIFDGANTVQLSWDMVNVFMPYLNGWVAPL